MISVRHVNYQTNGKTILNDLSLEVNEAELFCLLGPSGCGKTTTLRLLAGFISPASGTISRPERIGMMFQNDTLFSHLTVFENVSYALDVREYDKQTITGKVLQALSLCEISGLKDRYPDQLSGGQRQRAALARAIVKDVDLLLLDEPLSRLDPALRQDLRDMLKRLQRQLHITTIYVTHDREEALSLGDRIAMMHDGHIVETGTPEQLYEHPRKYITARFMGVENFFPDHTAIRPEHVSFTPVKDAIALDCTLESCRYFGSYNRYIFNTAAGSVVVDSPLHVNDITRVYLPRERLLDLEQ